MEKWLQLAKHNIKGKDAVESSWPGTYDGKYGHIVLSKERLIFVEEHGFLHHTADVMLNLPYKHITNCTMENNQQLILTTIDGQSQYIASPYLSQVKTHLEPYIKKAQTTAPVATTR